MPWFTIGNCVSLIQNDHHLLVVGTPSVYWVVFRNAIPPVTVAIPPVIVAIPPVTVAITATREA